MDRGRARGGAKEVYRTATLNIERSTAAARRSEEVQLRAVERNVGGTGRRSTGELIGPPGVQSDGSGRGGGAAPEKKTARTGDRRHRREIGICEAHRTVRP